MALEQGATAELEQVNEQSVEKVDAPSMDDTIRDTLRDLQSKGATLDTSEATPETSEEKAARIRDDKGKFAKTQEKTAPAIETQAAAEKSTEVDPLNTAPNTWKKDAAATWAALPPAAKAEISRREADFHRGIEGYRNAANFGKTMENAMAPYAQTLQSLGLSAEKAVSELMGADHRLRHGSQAERNAFFAELGHRYGIDMSGAVQAHQNINPQVMEMQQRALRAEQQLHEFHQSGQQQEQAALYSELDAFVNDPNHSHFPAVAGHVQALLQAGQATGLKDAYEQAVWANPSTRALQLAEQQAAQRAEADQRAKAAKLSASVNTRTRPAMPTTEPIGTMEDTIRAVLRKHSGA